LAVAISLADKSPLTVPPPYPFQGAPHFFIGARTTWVDFVMWDLLDQIVSVGAEPVYDPRRPVKATIAKRLVFANLPTLEAFYSSFPQR
jgi:hypothetical protein